MASTKVKVKLTTNSKFFWIYVNGKKVRFVENTSTDIKVSTSEWNDLFFRIQGAPATKFKIELIGKTTFVAIERAIAKDKTVAVGTRYFEARE